MTALKRVLYVEVEEEYVPVVIEESRASKKAKEVEVTVIDPTLFHVYKAS